MNFLKLVSFGTQSKVAKKNIFKSNLENHISGIIEINELISQKGWTVEETAVALGDSPLRLYRVLEGDEKLGRTATLAALALKNELTPIEEQN